MTQIHASAIIEPGARLDETVSIGPYCIVGAEARLEAHVQLLSHVVVTGNTVIGAETRIFPFASIGHQPQDLKYKGESSQLVIGRRTIIREHVTINPGTAGGGLLTVVGDDCLLMVNTHVAHDCRLGNGVIMANNATLAGHVVIGDFAILGGLSAVHQFVRIGKHAMIGGLTGVERDVIPFGQVVGDRARLVGLNIIGLQRRGYTRDQIQALRVAYQTLFGEEGTLAERVDDVAKRYDDVEPVHEMIEFLRVASQRGICQPKGAGGE